MKQSDNLRALSRNYDAKVDDRIHAVHATTGTSDSVDALPRPDAGLFALASAVMALAAEIAAVREEDEAEPEGR